MIDIQEIVIRFPMTGSDEVRAISALETLMESFFRPNPLVPEQILGLTQEQQHRISVWFRARYGKAEVPS